MMYNFVDTSAILNGFLDTTKNCYISTFSLMELENIKDRRDKDNNIKMRARTTLRALFSNSKYQIVSNTQKELHKILKKYNYLLEINDHYILCEAELLGVKNNASVYFYTNDIAQYHFANLLPHLIPIIYQPIAAQEEYKGWEEKYPTDVELASLYAHPENNVLNLKQNEFAKIIVEDKIADIMFWAGERYRGLKYQNFTSVLGEQIKPRNIEQKMLFHLLQDDDIKIKLCLGTFGTGKTFLMLQHALKGVKDGKFSKIIYIRNNIITKGSQEIGYLSGSLIEKIKPYIMPLADLTTPEYLDEIIQEGILEPVPLGFLRGRDFSNNTLIFCDEAENLTKENVQLLIGRIGEGSQLWLAGDLKQIDDDLFEKNNGVKKMITSLTGQPLFGYVKLIKSERSVTSQMADLMD